jgi:hypothetical protein
MNERARTGPHAVAEPADLQRARGVAPGEALVLYQLAPRRDSWTIAGGSWVLTLTVDRAHDRLLTPPARAEVAVPPVDRPARRLEAAAAERLHGSSEPAADLRRPERLIVPDGAPTCRSKCCVLRRARAANRQSVQIAVALGDGLLHYAPRARKRRRSVLVMALPRLPRPGPAPGHRGAWRERAPSLAAGPDRFPAPAPRALRRARLRRTSEVSSARRRAKGLAGDLGSFAILHPPRTPSPTRAGRSVRRSTWRPRARAGHLLQAREIVQLPLAGRSSSFGMPLGGRYGREGEGR